MSCGGGPISCLIKNWNVHEKGQTERNLLFSAHNLTRQRTCQIATPGKYTRPCHKAKWNQFEVHNQV